MKSLKIILISTLLIIAGTGYSQQMNADQDKNDPESGIIKTEQESLNPTLIPEGKRMMQEASGQEGKIQPAPTEDPLSPTIIRTPTPREQSSGTPVKTEVIENESPSPTLINRENQKPDTH